MIVSLTRWKVNAVVRMQGWDGYPVPVRSYSMESREREQDAVDGIGRGSRYRLPRARAFARIGLYRLFTQRSRRSKGRSGVVIAAQGAYNTRWREPNSPHPSVAQGAGSAALKAVGRHCCAGDGDQAARRSRTYRLAYRK